MIVSCSPTFSSYSLSELSSVPCSVSFEPLAEASPSFFFSKSLPALPLTVEYSLPKFLESRLEWCIPIVSRISLREEYPEIFNLARKLRTGADLTPTDRWNLNELSEATGWDVNDVKGELLNLDVDPSRRADHYKSLFERYYVEAKEFYEKSKEDWSYSPQAAEKLWGTITALIRFYAAKKGVFVAHWSRGKLDNFVANNVEVKLRDSFRDLLAYGSPLHESHFYEFSLTKQSFEYYWNRCKKLIDHIKNTISF